MQILTGDCEVDHPLLHNRVIQLLSLCTAVTSARGTPVTLKYTPTFVHLMVCRVCAFEMRVVLLHSAKRGASLYLVLRRLAASSGWLFSKLNKTITTLCSP